MFHVLKFTFLILWVFELERFYCINSVTVELQNMRVKSLGHGEKFEIKMFEIKSGNQGVFGENIQRTVEEVRHREM